jgi:hypothetical protein
MAQSVTLLHLQSEHNGKHDPRLEQTAARHIHDSKGTIAPSRCDHALLDVDVAFQPNHVKKKPHTCI